MSKHAQASRRATLAAVPPSASYLAMVIYDGQDDGHPRITWDPVDGEPFEVAIERRMNAGSWVPVGTAYAEDGGWTDDSLLCGSGDIFDYQTQPHYLDGEAPWSNVATVEAYSSP